MKENLFSIKRKSGNSFYRIIITWNLGKEGEYKTTFEEINKEVFENNKSLQLVLSYISYIPKSLDNSLFYNGDIWQQGHYGKFIHNSEIPGLLDYICNNLAYDDYDWLSVEYIKVEYVDSSGIIYDVEFENFDSMFSSKEDAISKFKELLCIR